MNNRIKQVRKTAGLKQAEFAERIGLKPNTVTSYETGLRIPSDAVILSICREFNVNEHWLRTGEGDMFVQKTRDEELASFFADVLNDDVEFKRQFLSVLARLGEDEWELVADMARKLVDEVQKEKADSE